MESGNIIGLSMSKVSNGVGVLFYSRSTNRHLFLLRSPDARGDGPCWGLPGGKVEDGETLLDSLSRECREEIGQWPEGVRLLPLEMFTAESGRFRYHTFYAQLAEEFVPVLNDEHCGYAWIDVGHFPRPLHRGLFNTLTYDIIQEKIAIIHANTQ
jgi:8-oxo-dGTP pyrophosphatase MutT (NUDIX family)